VNDPFRFAQQASVPVMFLFDAVNVLTAPGVKFTKGNIQRGSVVELDGDENFQTLDFAAIYHDEAPTQDNMEYIHDCRMSEVMVPGQLPLDGNLSVIYFRTPYERETFRYLLELEGIECPSKLSIENITGSVFMRWGMYINEMNYVDDKLMIEFKLPNRYQPPDGCYRIQIEQSTPMGQLTFDKRIRLSSNSLRVRNFRPVDDSVWRIEVEDVSAFHGKLAHQRSELFR
jgi:hypothetical protein